MIKWYGDFVDLLKILDSLKKMKEYNTGQNLRFVQYLDNHLRESQDEPKVLAPYFWVALEKAVDEKFWAHLSNPRLWKRDKQLFIIILFGIFRRTKNKER